MTVTVQVALKTLEEEAGGVKAVNGGNLPLQSLSWVLLVCKIQSQNKIRIFSCLDKPSRKFVSGESK
jgi:hypothetical protein